MFNFFKKKEVAVEASKALPVEMNSILNILDNCAEAFTFPMLDNGYVYLGASRLSVYFGAGDWALVIEVFGFSPRAGAPDLAIHTFGSNLRNRKSKDEYVSEEAYENYLKNNTYNEYKTFFPIGGDDSWINPENNEVVMPKSSLHLRGEIHELPDVPAYLKHGINLGGSTPHVYELCRYMSSLKQDAVLATNTERRYNVPDHLLEILSLDDWRHPDLADGEKPSKVEAFQQLSKVLQSGNVSYYKPTVEGNTHWKNWPDGGLL